MSTVGDLITWICIAIALWYVPRYLWRVYRGKHMSSESRVRSAPLPSVTPRFSARFEPEPEPGNPPNLALERRTDDRTGAFVLNPDELAAVARMIEHKTTAEKATKASIIWAGFGIKKGASAKYQRASEIYDALFIVPPSVVLYPDPENGGRVPASYPVSGRR